MSSPKAEPVFTSDFDPELPKHLLPTSLLRLVGIAFFGIIVFLLTMTDFFTRGGISSLPTAERDTLLRIGRSGFRIQTEPSTHFGATPHIIPKVRWQFSAGTYAVTGVTLHNAEMDEIRPLIPELRKLSGLKEIYAPYLTDAGIESIQKQFPKAVVSKLSQ